MVGIFKEEKFMKNLRTKLLLTMFLILSQGQNISAVDYDYAHSPYNYDNNPNNYDNSSRKYENSPRNYDNSPNKYGNERIIRDNDGEPTGYAVPKPNGGVNYFDFDGNRINYQ